jgi:hypothetical protein
MFPIRSIPQLAPTREIISRKENARMEAGVETSWKRHGNGMETPSGKGVETTKNHGSRKHSWKRHGNGMETTWKQAKINQVS